mmetsp:Transcript_53550/g.115711  ORF Transcript_53550/g.115711 Transcript_53550/m.115711 type:complete len:240 (-) Transcript_53550:760-1479(-)
MITDGISRSLNTLPLPVLCAEAKGPGIGGPLRLCDFDVLAGEAVGPAASAPVVPVVPVWTLRPFEREGVEDDRKKPPKRLFNLLLRNLLEGGSSCPIASPGYELDLGATEPTSSGDKPGKSGWLVSMKASSIWMRSLILCSVGSRPFGKMLRTTLKSCSRRCTKRRNSVSSVGSMRCSSSETSSAHCSDGASSLAICFLARYSKALGPAFRIATRILSSGRPLQQSKWSTADEKMSWKM